MRKSSSKPFGNIKFQNNATKNSTTRRELMDKKLLKQLKIKRKTKEKKIM